MMHRAAEAVFPIDIFHYTFCRVPVALIAIVGLFLQSILLYIHRSIESHIVS